MEVTRVTVKLFFDYVEDHPNAFILGVRELHGASPVMRNALRSMMNNFAQDIAEDIQILNLLPEVNQATLLDIAEVIGREMFLLSMDYIEQPEQRSQICEKAQRLITSLTVGHAVLNGYGPVLSEALS